MQDLEGRPATPTGQIYQLKVTLLEVVPRIWRRFQVTGSTKLSALHRTLQVVMGWENAHLHRFEINGVEYGTGPGSCHKDPALKDVVAPRLDIRRSQVRRRPWSDVPTVFFYEYDFGDGWGHELRVEKVSKPDPRLSYPRCLAGARAAPPEDCGGPLGYCALVDQVNAERFEQRVGLRDNRAGDEEEEPARLFDPGRFDLEEINAELGVAPRRREPRPAPVEELPDGPGRELVLQARKVCALVRAALVTDDVRTIVDAQHVYISAARSMLARLGIPKPGESSLAEAAWLEIRSPEVAPALRELHDLGGRLFQHIDQLSGRRHPRRKRA